MRRILVIIKTKDPTVFHGSKPLHIHWNLIHTFLNGFLMGWNKFGSNNHNTNLSHTAAPTKVNLVINYTITVVDEKLPMLAALPEI